MLTTKGQPCNGGLITGPVPREADLARRLLNDVRLASHCGGELPCKIHLHANIVNDWHVDLKPPAPAGVFSGASAWIAIFLQDHPDRDGLSVLPGSHKEGYAPRAPLHIATRAGDVVVFDLRVGQLPNRAERLVQMLAWGLYRCRLVDETGRQRLLRLFRLLMQLLQLTPATGRLAIFLFFASAEDIFRKYAALREWAASDGVR